MKQTLSYNIHDILKFQIIRDRKFDFRDLINLRFSSFQVDEVDKPDIVLNIGKFTPSNTACYLIDHKYYIKDNYVYCRESEGAISWEVEITGLERGDTIINCQSSMKFPTQPMKLFLAALFVPQAFLLRVIDHKLSTSGYFLTHSAAVSNDNQAFLFSGRSGCFKTSLCMDFVRHAGFTWLGDDRVILYQDKVFGFPMNSVIFEFMTKHLPDEAHLRFSNRVQFVVEHLLGKHQKTADNGAKSAKLRALLLISKNSGLQAGEQLIFSPVPQTFLEQVVDSLLISKRLEDFLGLFGGHGINSAPFLRYMLAYTFAFPNSSVATQEEKLAQNLRSSLENIPIYKVEIPSVYSADTFNQVHQFIINNGWD